MQRRCGAFSDQALGNAAQGMGEGVLGDENIGFLPTFLGFLLDCWCFPPIKRLYKDKNY